MTIVTAGDNTYIVLPHSSQVRKGPVHVNELSLDGGALANRLLLPGYPHKQRDVDC